MIHSFLDVFSVVGNAIRQEGFFCMWRGMGPTLLRDVPFSGRFCIYWFAYIRDWVAMQKLKHVLSALAIIVPS